MEFVHFVSNVGYLSQHDEAFSMNTADKEYLVYMVVAESLQEVYLMPSTSGRHRADVLSEHCSALLASDSILEDKHRKDIRTLKTSIRKINPASGQDVHNIEEVQHAALVQLEAWRNAQPQYTGVLSSLLRQSSWPEFLEGLRESLSESFRFQNTVKRLKVCINKIKNQSYTKENAEELCTELCTSFRCMITAFSEVSKSNHMASTTIVDEFFELMQKRSQEAERGVCGLIRKCLDLMTGKQNNPTIFA